MKKARVDIFTGHGYWFWWKLTASNGKIICHTALREIANED